MRIAVFLVIVCLMYLSAHACPPDRSSAGIVMNNGEYCNFDKIESLGQNGVNYLRENIQIPVQTIVSETTMVGSVSMGKTSRIALPFSATLVSDSFVFDPNTSTSFSPEPFFTFNNDTLIVHDYWALHEQPTFHCLLSVSHDTLFISYLPDTGIVYDWMPTVETILKIKLSGVRRPIVCCFNAVQKHARSPSPTEVGFGDARINRYATVSVPPLFAYKYRAHSCPSAMVYLHYERMANLYRWICPRITITFDSAALSMDSTPFAAVLSEELKLLTAAGVCTPSPNTMTRLASMSSATAGGWCYWTKQDSVLWLNQWFTIEGNKLQVWGARALSGGCGLGTDFQLPPGNLVTTGTSSSAAPHSAPSGHAVTAFVHSGMLTIASSMSFDKMAVYNLLGREIYSIHFTTSMKQASVPLVKTGCVPGNYVIAVNSSDRRTICRPIAVQH